MSVTSIALALRKSSIARLAVLPAIAMLACACVSEALAPEKNSSNSATNNSKVIVSNSMPDEGFVSLDERILRSTIIARATMRSASAYARQGGNPSDRYFPMVKFTFDVHEYLKGSGGNTITANISVECPHLNWAECGPPEQEAIDDANEWLSRENNRWWESRESIIFLEEDNGNESKTPGQSATPSYKFLPWLGDYATTYQYPYSDTDGYSVLSERNRVWLPATTESSSASGSSDSRFMLGERPHDLPLGQNVSGLSFNTDISLSDLKARIKSIANMVAQGKGVAGYEECLRAKYSHERSPWIPYSRVFPVKSGQKAGTVITSGSTGGLPHYDLFFLTGTDAIYFEIVIEDDNSDPYDNYHRTAKTLRPLVAADYSVIYHDKPGILTLCIGSPIESYTANPTANWTIHATAPAGTLHEAFFDPVAIGAAVGADGDNGALTPAAFQAAGGADAEIRRIDWASDVVKIEIANPPASLADHHIDFIALDGSVALRLDFGDAAVADAEDVRAFSWGVCRQPWSAGDKLMLRISESPPDLAGATNDASCVGEIEPTQSPPPSATSTHESSTQATPAPTSTATVAPVSQPAQTPAPTPR